MTASLLGLEKKSLREQAVTALRRAITSGELEPGRHLVETELSEMLGISRGTLREALRQLEQEGLASAGPRGRLSVRHLDEKEIRDIFSVRAALESLAARTLIDQPRRAKAVGELREALELMADAADRSLEDRIEADLDFHRLLCRLSGNETLLHQWQSLEGSIRMSIMFAGLERATSNMSVARHREIVDAIESGDAVTARETILSHMDAASENLVS
ncbi:GntR family transcriptional regulator [Sinomonas sp. R1AF57]|uniref:GntR family transcriptional regulator n=1 Tax=Sinomonas sp. R1AF57 TaxID=2020377 RepID=UPI000B5EEB48|nr:GntR family transcriptional regulator [Sinomonas sp. R1AF57]ASN53067.1 GntR family transcriptional regulator [Sinomonas sp. R1AF57]